MQNKYSQRLGKAAKKGGLSVTERIIKNSDTLPLIKKVSSILNPHLPHAIIISQGAGCPDANSAPRDERPGNEVSPRSEMCVDKETSFL